VSEVGQPDGETHASALVARRIEIYLAGGHGTSPTRRAALADFDARVAAAAGHEAAATMQALDAIAVSCLIPLALASENDAAALLHQIGLYLAGTADGPAAATGAQRALALLTARLDLTESDLFLPAADGEDDQAPQLYSELLTEALEHDPTEAVSTLAMIAAALVIEISAVGACAPLDFLALLTGHQPPPQPPGPTP
jgi:hypothetical protein